MTATREHDSVDPATYPTTFAPCPDPETVRIALESETVLGHRSGLHRLNPSGAALWQVFDCQSTIGDIADDVADVFDLEPQAAIDIVTDLVAELDGRGLLVAERETEATRPKYLGVPPST